LRQSRKSVRLTAINLTLFCSVIVGYGGA